MTTRYLKKIKKIKNKKIKKKIKIKISTRKIKKVTQTEHLEIDFLQKRMTLYCFRTIPVFHHTRDIVHWQIVVCLLCSLIIITCGMRKKIYFKSMPSCIFILRNLYEVCSALLCVMCVCVCVCRCWRWWVRGGGVRDVRVWRV